MANINVAIIIKAEHAPLARIAAATQGLSGEVMFERAVYKQTEITDYISSGQINEIFLNMMVDPHALFEAVNGAATFEQCKTLIENRVLIDCNVESPIAYLNRKEKHI